MLIFFSGLLLLLLRFTVTCASQNDGCRLPVSKSPSTTTPLYLSNNTGTYQYVIPRDDGIIYLRKNQSIILGCPGPRNYLKCSQSNYTTAYCVEGDTLRVANHNYEFNNISCKKPIHGSVELTHQSCGGHKGRLFQIGFRISRNQRIDLIKGCFDDNAGVTLYAEHYIYGKAIKYTNTPSYRPSFSSEGLPPNLAVAVAYEKIYQKSRLNQILHSARVAEKYIHGASFLARGHLAPLADFIYPAWEFATAYYINVCPQWQSINGGNWLSVETTVRIAAEKLDQVLRIITGTHGVLSLPDQNNNSVEIYLDEGQKLPVPEYLWKIVYSKESKLGIVFIAYNSPFIKEFKADMYLCQDICSQYKWGTSSWNKVNKGYIHCCDIREFRNVVSIEPLDVEGVLHSY